jgi:hypothetical protein
MSVSAPSSRPAGYDPDAALLALRPAIAGQPAAIPTPGTVADFQHQVLRPLLKLQHEVLLATVADVAHDYHLPLAAAPTGTTRPLTELLTCGPPLWALWWACSRGPSSPSTASTAPS